jgi:hypothetical protein
LLARNLLPGIHLLIVNIQFALLELGISAQKVLLLIHRLNFAVILQAEQGQALSCYLVVLESHWLAYLQHVVLRRAVYVWPQMLSLLINGHSSSSSGQL